MAKCGRGLVGACFALLVAGAVPAHAWNDFAHEVVARIAWEELEPEVRNRVLALFRQAPKDSLMHCLDLNQDRRRGCGRFAYRLGDAGSSEDADRILFERAAYWPDLARQLDKYNRPTWHYIGWTWRQGADGSAHDTDLPVAEPNAGDIHQPLHAASQVTERRDEREGDRGGNGFGLDEWNRQPARLLGRRPRRPVPGRPQATGARDAHLGLESAATARAVLEDLRRTPRP